jgi:protein-S-isoprenylcysteine O-methyltransferase Ste14
MADDTIGWLFVAAQAGLLVAILVVPGAELWTRPTWLVTIAGILIVVGIVIAAVAALRLGTGLTISPVPNGSGELQTDGLYGVVRHPIYTGLILALVGAALRSGSAATGLLVALTIAFFAVKARWEEQRLADRYPDYPSYAAATPRFVPNVVRLIRTSSAVS